LQQNGIQEMGVEASFTWWDDPKRMVFSLARYKFVSKMLEGCERVFEAGCADGFASRIVSQSVGKLVAVDIVEAHILSAQKVASGAWPIEFLVHDMLSGPVTGPFDGAFSLDVLEHIRPEDEDAFVSNMIAPLTPHGICIIGMPSIESQTYASRLSKQNHINCKNQKVLREHMLKYFHVVLPFSSNDEVIHTGYHAMSHYNMVVCTGKRD
jgi:cyclopropane fatty-acyl-phospholipid synthase-like methyltransferase